jgi:hypothetical protein
MSSITFYRQRRADGGTRTGIDVNGRTVLDQFEEGKGEPDPALVWYVDVRCEGARLPRTAESAQQWLIDLEPVISRGMDDLGDKLTAGIDNDAWPLEHTLRRSGGVKITIACSAMRRVDAKQIATVLRDIAAHWTERLAGLNLGQPA